MQIPQPQLAGQALDPYAVYSSARRVLYPQDPTYARADYQWHIRNTGQVSQLYHNNLPSTVEPGGNYDLGLFPDKQGLPGVVVGLIDSGCDTTHPDLKGVVLAGRQFNTRASTFDPNDYSDWNPASHGTAQAGIIAARHDGVGVQGIANCQLLVARTTMSPDFAGIAEVCQAIDWLVDNKAKIIVLPWGTSVLNDTLRTTLINAGNKGVLTICGTVNDPNGSYERIKDYPSTWKLPTVVSVCALDRESKVYWSAIGSGVVGAPGRVIVTTANGGGYCYVSGTSPASAVVAAVASVIRKSYPGISPLDVKNVLQRGRVIREGAYNVSVVHLRSMLDSLVVKPLPPAPPTSIA